MRKTMGPRGSRLEGVTSPQLPKAQCGVLTDNTVAELLSQQNSVPATLHHTFGSGHQRRASSFLFLTVDINSC